MKVSKTIGQRSLPPEYYEAIGKILVHWSWIEFRMQEALWHLLSLDRKSGRALTSEMEVRGLARALSATAERKLIDKTIRNAVRTLSDRIQAKIYERNRIVHGFWEYDASRKV